MAALPTLPTPTAVKDAVIAQPDPAARRRIFRAVDDNWDSDRGRYAGGASDRTIAAELSMPPAWIAMIRAENFGDAGGNDEAAELAEALAAALVKFETLAADALKMAERTDAAAREVRELSRRLSKVEAAFLPRAGK